MKRHFYLKFVLTVCATVLATIVVWPPANDFLRARRIEKAIRTGDFLAAYIEISNISKNSPIHFRIIRAALQSRSFQQYILDQRGRLMNGRVPPWTDVILLQAIISKNLDADVVLDRIATMRENAISQLEGDEQIDDLQQIDDIEQIALRSKNDTEE